MIRMTYRSVRGASWRRRLGTCAGHALLGLLAAGMLTVWPGHVSAQTSPPQGEGASPDLPCLSIWREKAASPPHGASRGLASVDRAFGSVYTRRMEARTFNWGLLMGGDGLSAAWFPRPGDHVAVRNMHYATIMLGVEEGPWHPNAQVHESGLDYVGSGQHSWEAQDGARGSQFNPHQTFPPPMYPLMAHSEWPGSWPAGGWPAPEFEEQVWWGIETWTPWRRGVGTNELFAEFDDSYAAREGTGEESVLGIRVRRRAIGFPALDAAFIVNEFRNQSSRTYTNVFVGQNWYQWVMSYGGDTHTGLSMHVDESLGLIWGRSRWYDPDEGTHTSGSGHHAPFTGFVILESPTGSFKTDALGNLVDTPDDIVTRRVLINSQDRTGRTDGLGRATLYGTMSGRLEYYGPATVLAEKQWKTDQTIDGSPVLRQGREHYEAYDPLWDSTDTAAWPYLASGPVTMAPWESFFWTVALVYGSSEQELFREAARAISVFQRQFRASWPPQVPEIQVNGIPAGPGGIEYNSLHHSHPIYYSPSGTITLSWDRSVAEGNPDPFTGAFDFQGYRLYRSIDRGARWGEIITDEMGDFAHWKPYRQWDKIDGVIGPDPSPGQYLSLGTDTGLVGSFTDLNVIDGIEYWYCLTTYDYDDHPDPLVRQDPEIYSLEAPRGQDPKASNVVAVIAGSRPNGYVPGLVNGASLSALLQVGCGSPHNYVAEGEVAVVTIDDTSVPAASYRITTVAGGDFGVRAMPNMVGVTLQNLTTGKTVYEGLIPEYFDEDRGVSEIDLLPPGGGVRVRLGTLFNTTIWDDPAVTDARLRANPRTSYTLPTGYGAQSAANAMRYARFVYDQPNNPDPKNVLDAATRFFSVEVRFDSTASGGQMAYVYTQGTGEFRAYHRVPFTVWDVSARPERQINVAYSLPAALGDHDWYPSDAATRATRTLFLTSNYSGDTTPAATYTDADARFADLDAAWYHWPLLEAGTTFGLLHGRKARFTYTMPIGPGWTYAFTTTTPTIDQAAIDLDRIRVVPNPYFIHAAWDRSDFDRKIQFRNVPAGSTIDIYTLAGELVTSLSHEGDATAPQGRRGYYSNRIGTVDWKIWSYEYIEVAYGLYIYVVKAPNGDKKVGKFAIIR